MDVIGLALATFVLVTPVSAVNVASCGMTLGAGQTGRLTTDLDCRARSTWPFSALGVRLAPGATLEMNGHAIRGDGTGVGIECHGGRGRGACRVHGPGEVSGFWAGMNGGGCHIVVRGVVVRANTYGVMGPLACRVDATNVNVVDNLADGVRVWRLRADHLAAMGNGGSGVVAGRLAARALLAAHNDGHGVAQLTTRGRLGRIVDSTVIENGAADIAATRVRLRRVRCGRSEQLRWPPVVDSGDDVPTVVGSFGCVHD